MNVELTMGDITDAIKIFTSTVIIQILFWGSDNFQGRHFKMQLACSPENWKKIKNTTVKLNQRNAYY